MKKYILGASFAALSLSCTETEEPLQFSEGKTSLSFDAKFGSADFELNKVYTPTGGLVGFQFQRLRYWVSNVSLINEDGTEYLIPESYYLIEETNEIPVQDGSFNKVYPANKRETVEIGNIPAGDYKGVKFHIGVEPKYNDNLTLQTGELNPLNGMAKDNWMWFTSYIFTSISGSMNQINGSGDPKNFFWETGTNTLYGSRSIAFDQPITIHSGTNSQILLVLDMQQVMDIEDPWSNNQIGATQPTLMAQLKDNFLNAFQLGSAVSSRR